MTSSYQVIANFFFAWFDKDGLFHLLTLNDLYYYKHGNDNKKSSDPVEIDVGLARGRGIRHPPDIGPRVEVSDRGDRTIRAAGADEDGVARQREPPGEPTPLVAGAAEDADDKVRHVGLAGSLPPAWSVAGAEVRLAVAGPAVRIVLPLCHAPDPVIDRPGARTRAVDGRLRLPHGTVRAGSLAGTAVR